MIKSGFDYWPQTDGDTIQYNIFTCPATWSPETMEISEQPGAHYEGNFLITTSFYGNGSFASYVHGPAIPAHPVDMSTTQVNKIGIHEGIIYIGECMNSGGNVMFPPEPKLAVNLIPGQGFDVYSAVFQSETDRTICIDSFHTKYRTLRFQSFPTFPDAVITAIAELNPDGTPGWVGNYYFQKGVGIFLQYGGIVNPDGTIDAIKLFKNP